MKPVTIRALPEGANSVKRIALLRGKIDSAPLYQRQGDVWSKNRQALFIDSLINGFDIPKLYFHDLVGLPPEFKKGAQYAVVDGKQRLQAIWKFLDGDLALSDEFEFLEDEDTSWAGKYFEDLPPRIQSRLLDYQLPIFVISTDDVMWIEELFSRMNEAVALNAPERRNALGGPLPPIIRELSTHAFFTKHLPFRNNRYKHLDLAVKFLYIEHKDGAVETKRGSLDQFVRDFKEANDKDAALELSKAVRRVLARLMTVFTTEDELLGSLGVVVVYYLLERDEELSKADDARDTLTQVDALRRQIRAIMRARSTDPEVVHPRLDPQLVEFERLSQSPNDVTAMRKRAAVVREFVSNPKLIKKKFRELNEQ